LKFYFSSHNLASGNFDWARQLPDFGFDGWEVVNEGNQCLEYTLPLIRELAETTDLGFTVHGPYSDLNPASVNHPMWKETVRQLSRTAELASEITDIIVVHPGNLSPLGYQMPDLAWKQHVNCLREACDFAEDFGISFLLENMINLERLLCRNPEELLGMIEDVDRTNMGACLDVGHANNVGKLDEFLKHSSEFKHLHLHDNDGSSDQHLPPGRGTIDWEKVKLSFSEYTGRAVIEARNIDEGIEGLEFLRKIMG